MEAIIQALFGGAGPPVGSGRPQSRQQGVPDSSIQPQEPDVEVAVIKAEARTATGAASRTASGAIAAHAAAAERDHEHPLLVQQQQQQQQPQQQQPSSPPPPSKDAHAAPPHPGLALTAVYGITNLSSVVMIVVANKKALYTYKFNFPVALTWLHAVFTAVGMGALARAGFFQHKAVSWQRALPVAAVYVAFVVFNNWSIQLNPLGFYQMSKLGITPVLVAIEWYFYRKAASSRVLASVAVLMVGITMCTVTDAQVSSNPVGVMVAVAAVLVTALYQVWAGTKQKELGLNGMQLLQQVSPLSVMLLAALIPLVEPVGWASRGPGTILGFEPSAPAVAWILVSSALGLVVTLSTFLFIGATSSLTYNVVGHLKTVLIVAAGVFIFGEGMGLAKLLGLVTAIGGILWYSQIKMTEARSGPPPSKA